MQQQKQKIIKCTISFLTVIFTQFSLSLIPRFFFDSSLLLQLTLSGLALLFVLTIGRFCKRILGVNASAPAFVFFNLIFVWSLYLFSIRPGVSNLVNFVFNLEVVMLLIGLCSMLWSDPGVVRHGSSRSDKLADVNGFDVEAENEEDDSIQLKRVRYCKSCKAYVKGFDHHCPAFGNCIGQSNHVLFMVLLLGFLSTEASYVICSFQFVRGSHIAAGSKFETGLCGSLIIGSMLFALLQVLWQVIFMAWHIYCICFNIKTDEWINWNKYPEFQVISQTQPGANFSTSSFVNPYDKGILQNLQEFCALRD